jgi:4-diphosphocytidyl-2-C-methyl-D-erythritol kinase
MEETGYAKINLALHVRERMPDGYHRIETLFAFAEQGDRLRVSQSDELRLHVTGRFAEALEGENLVLKAAHALQARFRVPAGAALTLDKRLPVASGIGGGSADAAAALRLLDRWWGLEAGREELVALAADLGADVPACVASRSARGEGRGDELRQLGEELRGKPLLLVNPLVPVATGAVFKAWDGIDRGPLQSGDVLAAALAGRNDLESPALGIAPAIGQVLELLAAQPETVLVRMSGSGATCFALFETAEARDRAEGRIASSRPHWWTLGSCLR